MLNADEHALPTQMLTKHGMIYVKAFGLVIILHLPKTRERVKHKAWVERSGTQGKLY